TSRAPWTTSRSLCSARTRRLVSARTTSHSRSLPLRWTSGSRTRRAAPAGSSGVAAAWSTPTSSSPRESTRRSTRASPLVWVSSAPCSSATGCLTCATWSKATSASPCHSGSAAKPRRAPRHNKLRSTTLLAKGPFQAHVDFSELAHPDPADREPQLVCGLRRTRRRFRPRRLRDGGLRAPPEDRGSTRHRQGEQHRGAGGLQEADPLL